MLAKLAAHASRAIALTHGIPAISQDQLDVARKARCAHFVRDAHKRSQSQDPPAISHVQLNIPAIFYKAGNTVTVLAKLAAHALHAIAHNAHTGFRNQDPPAVSHAQLNIHAKFHSCIRQETR